MTNNQKNRHKMKNNLKKKNKWELLLNCTTQITQ